MQHEEIMWLCFFQTTKSLFKQAVACTAHDMLSTVPSMCRESTWGSYEDADSDSVGQE